MQEEHVSHASDVANNEKERFVQMTGTTKRANAGMTLSDIGTAFVAVVGLIVAVLGFEMIVALFVDPFFR